MHITDKYVFFYGHELQIPESRLQMWYLASFDTLSILASASRPPNTT